MQSAIEADLKQLKLGFTLYERADKAISTKSIHKELSARLSEELDYKREASNIKLYSAILESESSVNVPEVIEDLSTKRLLTMTWLQGEKLTNGLSKIQISNLETMLPLTCSKHGIFPFIFMA